MNIKLEDNQCAIIIGEEDCCLIHSNNKDVYSNLFLAKAITELLNESEKDSEFIKAIMNRVKENNT